MTQSNDPNYRALFTRIAQVEYRTHLGSFKHRSEPETAPKSKIDKVQTGEGKCGTQPISTTQSGK
jgi:hypothetical protein